MNNCVWLRVPFACDWIEPESIVGCGVPASLIPSIPFASGDGEVLVDTVSQILPGSIVVGCIIALPTGFEMHHRFPMQPKGSTDRQHSSVESHLDNLVRWPCTSCSKEGSEFDSW